MTARRHVSRRSALKLGAATAALPLVHIRTAGAAGKLSLALWDHWVPTGDAAMKKLIDDWAEKNKVAVQVDFISSIGSKINITMAAEAQARTGHDVYAFDQWTVHQYADSLDPMDDVMSRLIAKYGKLGHAYEYLAFIDKHWMAVPVGWGSAPLPPVGRLSMWKKFAGVDLQSWFPAGPSTLEASDYPSLIGRGERITTIAVPTALVAFNWPMQSNRYQRVARFVDHLFSRIDKLQAPGFDPKWKSINLAATVPGLVRSRSAQEWLDRQGKAKQATQ